MQRREGEKTGEGEEGHYGAVERGRCLTGLELVKTEEIQTCSVIIRGECRKQHPCWGKSLCLYLKAKNQFDFLPEEKKLKFLSSVKVIDFIHNLSCK